MKRICTLLMTSCALLFAQILNAQSVSVSTTDPNPTPDFNAPDSVTTTNGFSGTRTKINEFPGNGKENTLTSPSYFYTSDQSAIYFVVNCKVAIMQDAAATPQVEIVTAGGTVISAVAVTSTTFAGASDGIDYYFTFLLSDPLPAFTNFTINLTMQASGKTIAAETFATNAIKGIAPAEGPVTLPVNFSNFLAQKASDGVALAWNVGQEQNVSNYQVERSTDGAHFVAIGSVAASGHPSYSFIDRQPVASAYYRIKANDKDGKYKYSSVLSVKDHQSSTVLKAFPSPVQSQLTVQHSAAQDGSSVQVFAMDGRMIQSMLPASGAQQTSLDLSSAKAGVYMVKFVNGAEVEALKVVKQ